MTAILLFLVACLLIIAFSEYVGERLGLVAPVILLFIGILIGLHPQMPYISISPELLIEGILPPLLFSAAVQMPTRDFRRNLGTISSLAIILVIVSSLSVGAFLHFFLNINYATAIALGAILSPTDAVATSIVKRLGVSHRLVVILEGEGLMNDAAALVLLRAAIASLGASVSLWSIAGSFAWSIIGALLVGFVVGHLTLRMRARITHGHASTLVTFTVPFLASIPAEYVGASGLVAAVMAGLVTRRHMAALLPPATRNVAAQTWGTVGLLLESLVFLLMGLQLAGLSVSFIYEEETWTFVILLALACIVLLLIVRAIVVYLTSLILTWVLPRRRLSAVDRDYFSRAPLGPREDALIIWSGMRGAVTLAAAQTLPLSLPDRGLYLVLAFVVATISLVVQGVSLPAVIRFLQPALAIPVTSFAVRSIRQGLHDAAEKVAVPSFLHETLGEVHPETLWKQLVQWQHSHQPIGSADDPRELAQQQRLKITVIEHAIELVKAQRLELIRQCEAGLIEANVYSHVMEVLDSDQLRLEIHHSAAVAGVEDAVEDEITQR